MPHSRPASRILLIRPSALGDVCRTVPVLTSLRAAWPQAHITWLVQDVNTPAVAAHPALNDVMTFPRQAFAQWWRDPAQLVIMRRWLRDLRQARYDLVIDCQGLFRSGLMTRASRAAVRVGHRDAREFAWLAYTHRGPRRTAHPHTVDHMLSLLSCIDVPVVRDMCLYTTDDDEAWWTQQRENHHVADVPYAVLAPTARWESKRWPAEQFAALIPHLQQRGMERIVITGGPNETDQLTGLQSAIRDSEGQVIDMVGRATVGQTMSIIRHAGLVVANDSAPLHMAVGFDRPIVALFGPTDPAKVGPYLRNDTVVRRYEPGPGDRISHKMNSIGDRLMRLIEVDDVLAVVDAQLQQARSIPADQGDGIPASNPHGCTT